MEYDRASQPLPYTLYLTPFFLSLISFGEAERGYSLPARRGAGVGLDFSAGRVTGFASGFVGCGCTGRVTGLGAGLSG